MSVEVKITLERAAMDEFLNWISAPVEPGGMHTLGNYGKIQLSSTPVPDEYLLWFEFHHHSDGGYLIHSIEHWYAINGRDYVALLGMFRAFREKRSLISMVIDSKLTILLEGDSIIFKFLEK